MTQEDKELLLRDLCGRLPYRIKCSIYNFYRDECEDEIITIDNLSKLLDIFSIKNIKPYLFPLSSMTEEQSKELEEIDPEFYSLICNNGEIYVSMDLRGYDWLNKNHLDYRGLIGKGLAIDATGLNIYL